MLLNIIQRYYSKIYILPIIDCCYMHMHAWSSHSVLYIKHADLLSGFFCVCQSLKATLVFVVVVGTHDWSQRWGGTTFIASDHEPLFPMDGRMDIQR